MEIWESIVRFYDWISNWLSLFFHKITIFFDSIINFFSYLVDIILALFYGAKTLFSWIMHLFNQILDWELFSTTIRFFNYISVFIWWPGALFLLWLFWVILVRIWIAFCFKLMRLNVDWKKYNHK